MKRVPTYIAVFKGSTDPETGINWCSDCVKADPFIKEHIIPKAKELNMQVYIVECGNKEVWKNKEHPLRVLPDFKLTGVPTMMYVENGKKMNVLVESEMTNIDMIEMFMEFD